MRVLILALVFANLAFFGWAHWIASDAMPRVDIQKASVPRLKLAREVGVTQGPTGAAVAPQPQPQPQSQSQPPTPVLGATPKGPAAATPPATASR